MKNNNIVYVGLSADILHEGHINILKIASSYGDVVVGLLTDEAIASYKNIPYLNFRQRKVVLENLRYVKKVIPQQTLDYVDNLDIVRPNYVVHGDDWKTGIQKKTRDRVLKALKKWSGKLIEPKYTKNISSTIIKNKISEVIYSINDIDKKILDKEQSLISEELKNTGKPDAIVKKISINPDAYIYLAESIRAWPDQAELASIMRDSGFKSVAWQDLTFGIVAVHIGYKA